MTIETSAVAYSNGVRASPAAIVDGLEWELLGFANYKPDSSDVIASGLIPTDPVSGAVEWIRIGPLDVPITVGDALAIALYAVTGSPDSYS